ncbi:diguanylate cyclase (GGDEF)-like protein [Hypnocyclicus thermotrophus]|uniref:Diguanylate cyclase (GGDEF)-like protein n=1 Tax=Hypnocyclicus thermotrophus TaxID=1627895 RepID=A0AA46DZA5_9FUSO|nr:diguanylate cyclase [Hypnocyclicus thermotrophus]TDT71753.1 diguanylate cyclase (GGDEF)-like protein [Hypnocyclicus thermotrophus]
MEEKIILKEKIKEYLKFSNNNATDIFNIKSIVDIKNNTQEFLFQQSTYLKLINSSFLTYTEKVDEYLNLLLEMVSLYKKVNLKDELIGLYFEIGNIFYDIRDYVKASEYFFKAYNYRSDIEDKSFLYILYNNIAILEYHIGEYEKAYYYMLLSLEEILKHSKEYSIQNDNKIIPFLNISQILLKLNEYNKALKYLKIAEVFIKFYNLTEFENTLFYLLNKTYLKLNKKIKKHSLHLMKTNNKKSISIIHFREDTINLIKNCILTEQYSNLVSYFSKVTYISYRNNLILSDIYKLASMYYSKIKNYKKAYLYSRKEIINQKKENKKYNKNISNNIEKKINFNYKFEDEEVENDYLNNSNYINTLSIINNIGIEITSIMDFDLLLEKIYLNLSKIIPIDIFGIGIINNKDSTINYAIFKEHNEEIKYDPKKLNDSSSLGAYCIRNKKEIIINNWKKEYYKYNIPLNKNFISKIVPSSILFFPLIIREKILGVLTLQSYNSNVYNNEHIEICRILTNYIAIALKNSIQSNDLKKEVIKRKKAEEELKNLNNKLRDLSQKDDLTKLYNKRIFNKKFNSFWNKAAMNKESITLIIIDIDKFKEFNDNYGHLMGDFCIVKVAETIKRAFNFDADVLARYGGDEFTIILYNTNKEIVTKKVNLFFRELSLLQIKHEFSTVSNIVTATLGAASIIPKEFNQERKLFILADKALYEAKKKGRNRIIYK